MASVSIFLGAPTDIRADRVDWHMPEGYQPLIPADLRDPAAPDDLSLSRLRVRPQASSQFVVTTTTMTQTNDPDLSDDWEAAPGALMLSAGSETWTVPGPAHPDALIPVGEAPYTWRLSTDALADSILAYWTANPTAEATLVLDDEQTAPVTPTLTPATGLSVQDGAAAGTEIGIAATPADFPAGTPAWRFGNGTNTSFLFDIDAATGQLRTNAVIDLAAMPQTEYTRTIILEQGGATAQVNVQIAVTAAPPPEPEPEPEPEPIDPPTAPLPAGDAQAAWLVAFPDWPGGAIRIWTGEGEIEIAGETYIGTGGLVSVGNLHAELAQPVRQMTIAVSLLAMPEDTRQRFLSDPGPRRVEVRQIYSLDGQVWIRIPRTFRGRLSAPRLTDEVYQIDVVTSIADIDRGNPQFWSGEAQVARYPGDRGLEYMRTLAAGLDIRWPP